MKERLVGGVLAADEDCCSTMAACAMSAFTSPGLCTARHHVRNKKGGKRQGLYTLETRTGRRIGISLRECIDVHAQRG